MFPRKWGFEWESHRTQWWIFQTMHRTKMGRWKVSFLLEMSVLECHVQTANHRYLLAKIQFL